MKAKLGAALFAALLVPIMAWPVFGLKLTIVGINLTVEGASTGKLILIALGTALVFAWQLLRDRVTLAVRLPLPAALGERLSEVKTQQRALWLLLVVALIWPFFASRGAVDIATLILIYVMLGLGLNIVVGLAGLLDLGYAGFYAIGAYTYALLAHYGGFGFWICLPLAGMMAAMFGCLLGFPVLRLRGDYLAIVTLGFGEIIRILLRNMTDITGGPNGMSIPNELKPSLFGLSFERRLADGTQTFHEFFGLAYQSQYKVIFLYLIALLLVLLTLFLVNRLLRMPLGRAWEALREDEIACRSLGLNPTVIKLSAFTIGASLAGLAGCFFAARQGLVTPESFGFMESAMILVIVVLGGMGSQLGVILAAVVMVLLQEMRLFSEYRMLIFGLMMIVMMLWRPQGLLPMRRPQLEASR